MFKRMLEIVAYFRYRWNRWRQNRENARKDSDIYPLW